MPNCDVGPCHVRHQCVRLPSVSDSGPAMPLFELTSNDFTAVQPTKLATLGIHERRDLQRVLRDTLDRVRDDLLVISEEFSDWNSARRMDLLALDREGHLVVIELKRNDGAHMELKLCAMPRWCRP